MHGLALLGQIKAEDFVMTAAKEAIGFALNAKALKSGKVLRTGWKHKK